MQQLRIKPQSVQSSQRTRKRDSWRSSSFAILAGYRQQRRAAAGPRLLPALGSRLLLVAAALSRALRVCCAACPVGLACLAIATIERAPSRGSHATEAARRTIAGFGLDFKECQKGFEQNRAWSIV